MRRGLLLTAALAAAGRASADPSPPTAGPSAWNPESLAVVAASSGTTQGTVDRGTLRVLLETRGTVRVEDVFRIKATVDGRIERVDAKPLTWFGPRKSMGFLLTRELAAMMDARSTTPPEIIEDRWRKVFQPTPILCREDCFVLRVFARPQAWVEPEAHLVEAARRLVLVGRVRPGDSHWVQSGQLVTFWAKDDPRRRQQARVEKFTLDVQGDKVGPGGTFTALLSPDVYLNPDTEWEGLIEALVKKDVLRVPTSALLRYGDEYYLPVRVWPGITTYDLTEVSAGAVEGARFLYLDNARSRPIPRASPEAGPWPRLPAAPTEPPGVFPSGRTDHFAPPSRARRKKFAPPKIDVFPKDKETPKEESLDERYPSDLLR